MHAFRNGIGVLLLLPLFSHLCLALVAESTLPNLENAIRIFNSIHSSMRQWGSSLNHNGMSFHPARAPKGVRLYHGNGDKSAVKGMQWLAFEPEHAMAFAMTRPRNRTLPPSSKTAIEHEPLHDETRPPFLQPSPGWLHTYEARHDPKLLYADGMSAGKTTNGTVDSQDYIIQNATELDLFFDDYSRALNMCAIAQDNWRGRVNGFIRMEAGFEIILCDFEAHLNEILVTRTNHCRNEGGESCIQDHFSWMRAITDRYYGIGGHRVRVNYDDFFTTYAYDLDLFNSNRMPRLEHLPAKDIAMLRADLDRFILKDPNPLFTGSTDWQAIADLIVIRYAERLKYLTSHIVRQSRELLKGELQRTLRPFIDFDHRDSAQEIERCTFHFIPPSPPQNLASNSIALVSKHLCTELVESFRTLTSFPDNSLHHSLILDRLEVLIQKLDWTVWKECGPCDSSRVFFIPIWPFGGTMDDWLEPSCLNASQIMARRSYWGMGPGRPVRPNATSEDFFWSRDLL